MVTRKISVICMAKERVTMNENDYAYDYRNCTQVTKTKTTIMKTIEVVAAIIHHEGKYLATQRGYGDYKGQWEFPGGKIEPGEAREEALIREIREELRMEIVPERWLCTTEHDYPTFHLTMHCYLCRIVEGTPQLTEHLAAQWLSPEELHSVEWLPADVEVTSKLKIEN